MPTRSTESVLLDLTPHRVSYPLEPTIDTTDIRCRTLRPPGVSKMEPVVSTVLVTGEWETSESDATTSEKEASAHVCRKRRRLVANRTAAMDRQLEKALSFLEVRAVQHTLVAENPHVADAEVDKESVAFFNEK